MGNKFSQKYGNEIRNSISNKELDIYFYRIYTEALNVSEFYYSWYHSHARFNMIISLGLKLISILLIIASGIIPFVKIISPNLADRSIINSDLGYMLIVIAGFLLLIDKFFNNSNNWIRNIIAELKIRNEISKLHQNIMIKLYNSKLKKPYIDNTNIEDILKSIQEFTNYLYDIIENETKLWKNDIIEINKELNLLINNKNKPGR